MKQYAGQVRKVYLIKVADRAELTRPIVRSNSPCFDFVPIPRSVNCVMAFR